MSLYRTRSMSISFLLGLMMLALAGCGTQAAMEQLALPTVEVLPALGNRLLVVGVDGNIYTVNPDGSGRFALTDDASSGKQYLQPTWSSNGERIAWSEVETTDGDATSRLVMSAHDGSGRATSEVPFAPFYLYWSPDNSRLAYLSNWQRQSLPSMALRLADAPETLDNGDDVKVTTLAEGQPFYFSWAPNSQRLFTHVGEDQLGFQDLDGKLDKFEQVSAAFPAPQWAMSGEELVYAIDDEGRQRLVMADLEGEIINDLTDFSERITFSLSPDGNQLAYIETESDVGMAALGPLYVVDLATMSTRELSAEPAIAFFWSPDGSKLAYMVAEPTARTAFNFRWNVWDGDTRQAYADFTPSRTFFQSYLSFFDQYAQSMSMWSPDSSAFTYAGSDNGLFGVWVQELGEDVEPQRVARGVVVSWSPQ